MAFRQTEGCNEEDRVKSPIFLLTNEFGINYDRFDMEEPGRNVLKSFP